MYRNPLQAPFAPIDQGLGELTAKEQLDAMHATAVAIYNAKAAGDVEEVTRLRDVLRQQSRAYLQGSGVSDQLGWVDKLILDTGNWIQSSVNALPGAIAALPSSVGVGLIRAAIPWVAGYFAIKWLAGKV